MFISYYEYLEKTGKKDSRKSWIDWKTECCGMDEKEAIKSSYKIKW